MCGWSGVNTGVGGGQGQRGKQRVGHREEFEFYSEGDGEPLGFLGRTYMPEKDGASNRERGEGVKQVRGAGGECLGAYCSPSTSDTAGNASIAARAEHSAEPQVNPHLFMNLGAVHQDSLTTGVSSASLCNFPPLAPPPARPVHALP